MIRNDGVTERRADGGTPDEVFGLPVGPSGRNAAPWFRMIRPVTRGNPNDLRLVSRMSDRNVSCRVLSPAPFPCNDVKHPLGQSGDVGVGLANARRESHS
ncbi:hypothetical protein GCM10027176_01350 [Actinoallomurus bryophytorum]